MGDTEWSGWVAEQGEHPSDCDREDNENDADFATLRCRSLRPASGSSSRWRSRRRRAGAGSSRSSPCHSFWGGDLKRSRASPQKPGV
jgi:hypothetical protein